ncbi:MAG: extracellular solute-binding protein [Phototrophicaceae bacterium]
MVKRFSVLALFLMVLSVSAVAAQDGAGVLNIYSSRHYGAMEAPFVLFQEQTGIELRVSAGTPRDLLGRLRADLERGDRSVADLFLAIDAGVLSLAAEENLLEPIDSEILLANIPASERDPENRWFGLSKRARTLIYNPENVTEDEIATLNTYAGLANPEWADRLCMRPASHIYTISTLSSVLYHLGEADASAAFTGISGNVTRYIDSDTSIIQAVAAGECDVALVNQYYMAALANGDEAAQATFNAVQLKWLNQGEDESGVFYNVNGAGVIRNAANRENAIRFIEFFSQVENQCPEATCFPGSNYEYPVNPAAEVHPTLLSFGEVKFDTDYALWDYGQYQEPTIALLEQVGFGFSEN